jgi:ferredoxin-type protein NapH
MKFKTLRRISLTAVLLLVVAGLIWHTGTGTLSSLGWRFISSICPLGGIETFLASKTIFPRALIVLLAMVLAGVLLGKFFCSWLCPLPPLRRLFSRRNKPQGSSGNSGGSSNSGSHAAKGGSLQAGSGDDNLLSLANDSNTVNIPDLANTAHTAITTGADDDGPQKRHTAKSGCQSGCDGCAEKRTKLDSRHLVLGGALLSTAIFGFPVFCLVCPVGLVFATLVVFWRWIGLGDFTFSLLVFPAILLIEVLVLRKWCLKICPLGAVLSLISLPNRFFRPRVEQSKCLRSQGVDCTVCVDSCDELLDPHSPEGMHECSKCGLCKDNCPTQAITIPFRPAARPPAPSHPSHRTPSTTRRHQP